MIDEFLINAKEVDVDAISDGSDVFIAGILEDIEEAGFILAIQRSLPPQSISKN